jgi:tetratricopeptide (TPR) repeat protein
MTYFLQKATMLLVSMLVLILVLVLSASAIAADNPQTRLAQSNQLRDAGKLDAAAAILLQLNQEYPELPEPYNNLAVIYVKQNQFEKARNALEMAIRTNPSYPTAYENLADLYSFFAVEARAKAAQLRQNQSPRTKP